MSFFSVPKTNPHKEVPKYIFYTLPKEPGPTVIKLSVFLKKSLTQISESENILCLGDILRLKYVLVENTL
jgi:hypothetical protein